MLKATSARRSRSKVAALIGHQGRRLRAAPFSFPRLADMERKRETIRYRRLISRCEHWRKAADIRAFVAAVEASALASRDTEALTTWKL